MFLLLTIPTNFNKDVEEAKLEDVSIRIERGWEREYDWVEDGHTVEEGTVNQAPPYPIFHAIMLIFDPHPHRLSTSHILTLALILSIILIVELPLSLLLAIIHFDAIDYS